MNPINHCKASTTLKNQSKFDFLIIPLIWKCNTGMPVFFTVSLDSIVSSSVYMQSENAIVLLLRELPLRNASDSS